MIVCAKSCVVDLALLNPANNEFVAEVLKNFLRSLHSNFAVVSLNAKSVKILYSVYGIKRNVLSIGK